MKRRVNIHDSILCSYLKAKKRFLREILQALAELFFEKAKAILTKIIAASARVCRLCESSGDSNGRVSRGNKRPSLQRQHGTLGARTSA